MSVLDRVRLLPLVCSFVNTHNGKLLTNTLGRHADQNAILELVHGDGVRTRATYVEWSDAWHDWEESLSVLTQRAGIEVCSRLVFSALLRLKANAPCGNMCCRSTMMEYAAGSRT